MVLGRYTNTIGILNGLVVFSFIVFDLVILLLRSFILYVVELRLFEVSFIIKLTIGGIEWVRDASDCSRRGFAAAAV